jgi:hypothetical protein
MKLLHAALQRLTIQPEGEKPTVGAQTVPEQGDLPGRVSRQKRLVFRRAKLKFWRQVIRAHWRLPNLKV